MGVGIILPDIVPVAGNRIMGSDLFQSHIVIVMQSGFIVIDKNRSGYMHRVAQYQAFLDSACPQTFLDFRRYVDKRSPGGHFKPQFFTVAFHFFHHFLILWDTDIYK
jgi:hypothetical protein